jgi:hypothetical protein
MVQAGGDWETACSCLGSIRIGARPMAIYRLLKFAAFDPEMIASMTAAYEDALRVLEVGRPSGSHNRTRRQEDH